MVNASCRPDRALHARDCQPGKFFYGRFDSQSLITIPFRLSGGGSILLSTLVLSSLGTISKLLRSTRSFSVVSLTSLVYILVRSIALSLPPLRN